MSKEIQINYFELISAANSAESAANSIDVKLDEWTSQGEKSIALDSYAEQFFHLELTMQLFQRLVNVDLDSISDIGRELFIADLNLSKLWK